MPELDHFRDKHGIDVAVVESHGGIELQFSEPTRRIVFPPDQNEELALALDNRLHTEIDIEDAQSDARDELRRELKPSVDMLYEWLRTEPVIPANVRAAINHLNGEMPA